MLEFSEELYQDFGEGILLWNSLFAYNCPSHQKLWMSAVELVTGFRFGLPVGNVRLVLWHGCMIITWLSLHQKGIMMFTLHSFRSEFCICLGGILPPQLLFFSCSLFFFLTSVYFWKEAKQHQCWFYAFSQVWIGDFDTEWVGVFVYATVLVLKLAINLL